MRPPNSMPQEQHRRLQVQVVGEEEAPDCMKAHSLTKTLERNMPSQLTRRNRNQYSFVEDIGCQGLIQEH